jgi:hypothetical protein
MKKKLTNAQLDAVAQEIMNRVKEVNEKEANASLAKSANYKEWVRLRKEEKIMRDKLVVLNKKLNDAFNSMRDETINKFNMDAHINYSGDDDKKIQLSYNWGFISKIKHRLILGTIDSDDINITIDKLVKEFSK